MLRFLATLCLSFLAAAFVLLPVEDPVLRSNQSSHVVKEKWSASHIRHMARNKKMEAAMSTLMVDAHELHPSTRYRVSKQTLDELIKKTGIANIRVAILKQTTQKKSRMSELARFARSESADATCSSAETVGGGGLTTCMSQCEEKRPLIGRNAHAGACFALCSLAVAPCDRGISSIWRNVIHSARGKMETAVKIIEHVNESRGTAFTTDSGTHRDDSGAVSSMTTQGIAHVLTDSNKVEVLLLVAFALGMYRLIMLMLDDFRSKRQIAVLKKDLQMRKSALTERKLNHLFTVLGRVVQGQAFYNILEASARAKHGTKIRDRKLQPVLRRDTHRSQTKKVMMFLKLKLMAEKGKACDSIATGRPGGDGGSGVEGLKREECEGERDSRVLAGSRSALLSIADQ